MEHQRAFVHTLKYSTLRSQFNQNDEESCMDYVTSYVQSKTLLELEDEGMSQLLMLDDLISQAIQISDSADLSADIPSATIPTMPSPHPSNMPIRTTTTF